MTKKEYMTPTTEVVKLQQQSTLLAGSPNTYGVEKELQSEEVTEGW